MRPDVRLSVAFCAATLTLAASCREEQVAPAASAPAADAAGAAVAGAPAPAAPAASAPAASAPVAQYQEAPDGAQTVVLGSLRIEAARDLPKRTSAGAGEVPSDGQIAITLRGWTVQVGGGRVVVAGRDFGPAPAEGLVRLSLAGVHVAGELRGPLPE